MVTITEIQLDGSPLNEVTVKWSYDRPLEAKEKFYLFKKKDEPISQDEIIAYIQNPTQETVPPKAFVFHNIPNFQTELIDVRVLEGHKYFYQGVVIEKEDVSKYSAIVSSEIVAPEFNTEISVTPTKEIVALAIEKIMTAIAKTNSGAKIPVYYEYPEEVADNTFIVVTRQTGESAYRFFSDEIQPGVYGDVDYDVIEVSWLCLKNPTLRDKLTNIFRGSKKKITRFLYSSGSGVLDAKVSLTGDSNAKVDNGYFAMGSMLVRAMIENTMTTQTELSENIDYELNFNTDNG